MIDEEDEDDDDDDYDDDDEEDDEEEDVLHMKWQYWEIPRFHGQDVSPSRGHQGLGWQRWHQKIQKELPMAPECSHQCLINKVPSGKLT